MHQALKTTLYLTLCCGLFACQSTPVFSGSTLPEHLGLIKEIPHTSDEVIILPEELAPLIPAFQLGTLAGTGIFGYTDGPSKEAQFYNPSAIEFLPNGNLLVLDRNNHSLREIDTKAQVRTFWGPGERGNKEGAATVGRMNQAIDFLLLKDGSLIIADAQNHSLRKISEGVLTTIAGDGEERLLDGNAKDASFNWPAALAQDPAGNIYIADRHNHAIRRMSPEGEVTTLAGNGEAGWLDGKGNSVRFNGPMGIVYAPDGFLYVADTDNNRIRKLSLQGEVSTFAGSGQSGSRDDLGLKAEFKGPVGLAFDTTGNLYLSDRLNQRIRRIDPEGKVMSVAGTGERGYEDNIGDEGALNFPYDIEVRGDKLYIADYSNHVIRWLQLPARSDS